MPPGAIGNLDTIFQTHCHLIFESCGGGPLMTWRDIIEQLSTSHLHTRSAEVSDVFRSHWPTPLFLSLYLHVSATLFTALPRESDAENDQKKNRLNR